MSEPAPQPIEIDEAVQRLVADCVQAIENDDAPTAEALLRAQPALSTAARKQIERLHRAGLLRSAAPAAEMQPTTIGPYRILDEIGRGGMGSVYLAEQREPVHRRVALKLVKLGMDTREVVARFGAERQALALMEHSNIAKVLDAGSTPQGRPYFVMEFVPGLPITDYCDRHALSMPRRLELFLAVCDAVAHAHGKGIIHRDLKPSNVLVTEQNGKPLPKVIDFGVAKAIGHHLTDATLHTTFGMVVGTPEYMSPEQATRDVVDIDTRSDVYSLGVMLYELLTGALPIESHRLRTDLVGLQRVLREEEPPLPSQRVTTRNDTNPAVAKMRATTMAGLHRGLRGDLDWICLCALEKERNRRYATVNDLAADIRRHLADEPIVAGRPGWSYRLRKFVRRNRLAVSAASAIATAVMAGLIVSVWFYRDASAAALAMRQALGRETKARDLAETNFERALGAVDKLLTQVADESLRDVPQLEPVRKALGEQALALCEDLLRERGDDARARLQTASTRLVVARVNELLGDAHQARGEAETAVAELRRLCAEYESEPTYRLRLAEGLGALGAILAHLDESAESVLLEAEQRFAAFAAEQERIDGTPDAHAKYHRRHAVALANLADWRLTRKPETAMADYERALRVLDALPAGGAVDSTLARTGALAGLAFAQLRSGKLVDAERTSRAALADLERLENAQTAAGTRRLRARLLHNVAIACFEQARPKDAVHPLRAGIETYQQLVRDFPRTPLYRADLASTFSMLSIVQQALLEIHDAADSGRVALELLEGLCAEHPHDQAYRSQLAREVANQAALLAESFGTRAAAVEGEALVRRGLVLYDQLAARAPDNFDIELARALAHFTLFNALIAQRRGPEANAAIARAVSGFTALTARHSNTVVAFAQLGHALRELADSRLFAGGQTEEVLDLVAQSLRAYDRADALSPNRRFQNNGRFTARCVQAMALARAGQHDEAAAILDDLPEGGWIPNLFLAEVWRVMVMMAPDALSAPDHRKRAQHLCGEVERALRPWAFEDADESRAAAFLARSLVAMAELQPESDAAGQLLDEALPHLRRVWAEGHQLYATGSALRRGLALRAELWLRAGGVAEALALAKEIAASELAGDDLRALVQQAGAPSGEALRAALRAARSP